MNIDVLTDEINRATQRFKIEIADSPQQLREVFRLRHQVYCVERTWLAGAGDQETDEYDSHSRHVLLRHASDGGVVGTVRIVAPDPANLADSFPMQHVCEPSLLSGLPLATTGEISRFALSKQRIEGRADLILLRLALLRGVVQVSSEMGLTHWLAVMERSLIRLHQTNEIYFDQVGPLVSYHGIRQPTTGVIARVLERIRAEQFPTWKFLTDNGRWFGRHAKVGDREAIWEAA
jgi:N-acyl-L-homoserine lactone synthetase